jgi:hypothetical protein
MPAGGAHNYLVVQWESGYQTSLVKWGSEYWTSPVFAWLILENNRASDYHNIGKQDIFVWFFNVLLA